MYIFVLVLSSFYWSVVISKCQPVEIICNCCHINYIPYPLCRHSYKLPVSQISYSKIQAKILIVMITYLYFPYYKKHASLGEKKSATAYDCDVTIWKNSRYIITSHRIQCTYMGLDNVVYSNKYQLLWVYDGIFAPINLHSNCSVALYICICWYREVLLLSHWLCHILCTYLVNGELLP